MAVPCPWTALRLTLSVFCPVAAYLLRQCIETYLRTTVANSLRGKRGDQLLKELSQRWRNHLIMNRWLFKFFTYLVRVGVGGPCTTTHSHCTNVCRTRHIQDRYYVDQHNRPKLRDAGLAAFQRLFLDFVPAVVEACMALVNKDRDGEYVEHALVKRVVEMFETLGQQSLGFYKSAFEVRDARHPLAAVHGTRGSRHTRVGSDAARSFAPQQRLVERTRDYYRSKAGRWLEALSTPAYLTEVRRVTAA